jgi:hypothetical protein
MSLCSFKTHNDESRTFVLKIELLRDYIAKIVSSFYILLTFLCLFLKNESGYLIMLFIRFFIRIFIRI